MTSKTIKNTKPRVTNPKNGKVKVSAKSKIQQRSFVCISVNGKSQKYNQIFGATPFAAASKHFSSWCEKNNKKGNCSAVIIIKESTRGSENKEYKYKAHRKKYSTPKKVKTSSGIITFKYVNSVKSHK